MTGFSVTVNTGPLVRELDKISGKAVKAIRTAVIEGGNDVRDAWVANATASAGVHGKHYPKSIQAKIIPSFTSTRVDIQPQAGLKQAGMSFEFGSRNQPPHLDGQRAIDTLGPLIERRIQAALAFL